MPENVDLLEAALTLHALRRTGVDAGDKVAILGAGPIGLMIDSNLIHYKECFVLGSHGSVPRHHRIALDLISSGAIDVRKLVTHRFPLDSILEAFSVVENREVMKAMIFP